jgi:hypothetical protein
MARYAANRWGDGGVVARDNRLSGNLRFVRIKFHLQYGAGRYRLREVRIENLQESFGDLWKLVVELAVDTCGEEGKTFDDTFDVRVLALFSVQ